MFVFSNGTRIFNVQKVDRGELMECNKNKKKDNEKNAKHLQQEKKNVNLQNISFYFFFSLFL